MAKVEDRTGLRGKTKVGKNQRGRFKGWANRPKLAAAPVEKAKQTGEGSVAEQERDWEEWL